ncbi:MAG: HAD family hydrolase [Clostridia bacterium]|nr:HAD family hydrolase [Clostridia bacterium]
MIKLIASDMDGTLLTTDKRLPGEFAQVVRELRRRGVSFCIASGRQYASLRRDLEALVPELIFIAENGALIMEKDQQLFIDPLEGIDLPRIVRAADGMDQVYPVICRSNSALVDKSASEAFVAELRMYYEQTFVVDDLAGCCSAFHDVCKVAFYDAGDAATHLLPVLQDRLGDCHAVILSGANWVDVMKPGVDKGRAMRMLQRLKGISPDQCMAFGDYLNDLEMLKSVGESYAMDNALEDIKRIARYIAPPNDENGVMRVVKERFAL